MSGKLGDILIQQGVIDEEKLIAALSDQRAFGGKLGRTLVDLGYVTEAQLVHALATQLALDTVDLAKAEITPEALSALPVDACERYGVFPLRVDPAHRILWLATAEPDRNTLLEVAQIAQHTVEPVLCTMSSIDQAVRRYYYGDQGATKARLGEPLVSIPGAPPPEGDAELAAGAVVPGMGRGDRIAELRVLLVRLEKQMNAQGRAFRALVEILQSKGIVRRGELGSHAAKKG
jgi:type IV pilus assembly protein PilB